MRYERDSVKLIASDRDDERLALRGDEIVSRVLVKDIDVDWLRELPCCDKLCVPLRVADRLRELVIDSELLSATVKEDDVV